MIINYITEVGKIRNFHIIKGIKGIELIKSESNGFHTYGFEFADDGGYLTIEKCKIVSVRS